MPGIKSVQHIPTSYTKSEIKGRDFYTQAGKSERIYLEGSKNVSHQLSSLKSRPDRQPKGLFLAAAVGISALATVSRVKADSKIASIEVKSFADNKSLSRPVQSAFSPQASPHVLQKQHSIKQRDKKIRSSPNATQNIQPVTLSDFNVQGYLSRASNSRGKNVCSDVKNNNHTQIRHEKNNAVKTQRIYCKNVERKRAKIQQLDRDVKNKKNEGDEQYWQPISNMTTPPVNTTPILNFTQQLEKTKHWIEPMHQIIRYLKENPLSSYLSLASNRLMAGRIAYSKSEYESLKDESLFSHVNQLLDGKSEYYTSSLATKFIRYESSLYYIQARIIEWGLDPSQEDFEHQFLAAHATRQRIFNAESILKFYKMQFRPLQRKTPEPFSTRSGIGDLKKYYEQFNVYLRDSASDDAANTVKQITAMQGISQLDLERVYHPLFSLRIGYYKTIPKEPVNWRTFVGGKHIYFLRGDSGKIYAASSWEPLFMAADVSELVSEQHIASIQGLRNDETFLDSMLDVQALINLLWLGTEKSIPANQWVIKKYSQSININMKAPTLNDAFITLQHDALIAIVVAFREDNLNKTIAEKVLSLVPFFDVIQRSVNDPHYSPTFSDLLGDIIDLGLTLIMLGIPLYKLGSSGIKVALSAMRTARLHGLAGALLRQAIFNAIKPTLSKMAKLTAKEVACFIIPPLDLMRMLNRLLKNPLRKVILKRPRSKKLIGKTRCRRAIGGACDTFTLFFDKKFNSPEWEEFITQIILNPVKWKGTKPSVFYRLDYLKNFSLLPNNYKEALRGWTYVKGQKPYKDSPLLNWAQGKSDNNFKLNQALFSGKPSDEMRRIAHDLSEALDALPKMGNRQQLIRVVDAPEAAMLKFSPGDIVSNYPAFMSASSSGKLANIALNQGFMFVRKWRDMPGAAIVVFKINGKSSKPFVNGVTTQFRMEGEYLFNRKSFFQIDAITPVKFSNPTRIDKPIFFIKLNEVSYDNSLKIKNIFTAEALNIKHSEF